MSDPAQQLSLLGDAEDAPPEFPDGGTEAKEPDPVESTCDPPILIKGDCLEVMKSRPDDCVDLIFGSPPYATKGARYDGLAKSWPTIQWIDWMTSITVEAVRLSRGHVVWVVNGPVRDGRYEPACEGLLWRCYEQGITCERPAIWSKNAAPSRGIKEWFSNEWEFCLVFKGCKKPFYDGTPVALPPRFKPGGQFRQRGADGKRKMGAGYQPPRLANPRDIVRVTVGGGHLGHKLAHLGEAPFPLKLATHFIATCCPRGGVVLDPFVGSGTTIQAAMELDRRGVGIDCRASQVDLSRRRLGLSAGGAA
jgi:site-specific DNA-methyltransferase (adenine-specific)